MKSESLNSFLTFVLGVLIVLAVVLAMRMALLTHEYRLLQKKASICQAILLQTQAVYNDTAAYNQKYYDPKLARILAIMSPSKPATR